MLQLIEENVQVLQEEYEAFIRGSCDEVISAEMAYLGRCGPQYWFESPGIWVSFRRPGRYWNGYGFSKPSDTSRVGIDFEVNYPFNGVNTAVAGALARDDQGTVFLVHRGKFRGGKGLTQRCSMEYFEQRSPERVAEVIERGRSSRFILVSRLIGGLNDLADFGRAVVDLKQTVGRAR